MRVGIVVRTGVLSLFVLLVVGAFLKKKIREKSKKR